MHEGMLVCHQNPTVAGLGWNRCTVGWFDLKILCVLSIADNLPVATRLEFYSNREEEEKKKEKDVQFEHGYRLGFMDSNKVRCS